MDWTGLDWTGLDWTGLDWTGLDWTLTTLANKEVSPTGAINEAITLNFPSQGTSAPRNFAIGLDKETSPPY